jgi:soluble lytic murein transglycosylase-like protein
MRSRPATIVVAVAPAIAGTTPAHAQSPNAAHDASAPATIASLEAGATKADVVALRTLATHYENGEGVARDPLHAYALYCKAAKAGDAEAQYDLGWMVLNGRGVARNDAEAAYFLTMAAAQGHVQAKALLAHAGPPSESLPECLRDLPPPPPPPPPPLDDGSSFVARNAGEAHVAKLVRELAPQFDVSPLLALAVIRAESNFDPRATSPKNAQGLMQLLPATSQRFNVRKPYDIAQNVRGGLAYLQWLLAYFEGNVPLVAAAYNAGEKTVDRYGGVPPYPETRDYVKRVMKIFGRDSHPYDAGVTEPSPQAARFGAAPAK